jgi:xanthine permease XanP
VISSRLLDVRRSLVIGLSMIAGSSVDIFPALVASAPKSIAPLVGSSLVFGTIIALGLNLLFRIGVKRKASLAIEGPQAGNQKIEEFFIKQGGTWGARPDIIKRATFSVIQLVEAVAENCEQHGPMLVTASFDEFNLDVRLDYEGALLEFPDRRPTDKEIRDDADGVRRLAGFMLRRNADRVRADGANGRSMAYFHFDH